MEEAQSSQINGDEFYETIEAPKFVDFTSSDQPHPDDRYWFCLRVGCDQKHEEELDTEAIYKNFVLRVMAARSPNVRLRKALNRKPQSMKCPLTAPPKSSKSRLSRLALITSISHKIVDVKDRGKRPISKISATPKVNSKQSCAATAKALTTPRNEKQISNRDIFRSVRNSKDMNIAVPKNKLVAKVLVFHSPKKTVKTKTSLKLNTAVKKICATMKKLEITGDMKHLMENNKSLPLHSTEKQKRGQKVESRVFALLHPHIQKDLEAKPLKCMKRKNKENDLKQSCGPEAHEHIKIDTNGMKVEESSDCPLSEACSASSPSKKGEVNDLKTTKIEHHDEVLSEASESGDNSTKFQATVGPIKKTNDAGDNEEKVKPSSKGISNSEDIDNDDKENALAFGTKGNDQVVDCDDKENASVSNDNINRELKGGKELSKHDTTSTKAKQVNQVTHKTLQKSSISVSNRPQEIKYRKPKPTNPKPFRLRTDERSILKEANLEKKLLTPLKEISSVGLQGGKSMRKHKNAAIHKNENCLRQNEHESYASEDSEKRIDKTTHVDGPGRFRTTTTKQDLEKGASVTTPQTCSVSMKQKASLVNLKCEDILDKTKSPVMRKKLATPQGFSSRKAILSYKKHGQLSLLKGTSSTILRTKEAVKMSNNDASPIIKASSSTKSSSVSRVKRPVTIPMEPKFHSSVRVPKSCTRKMT